MRKLTETELEVFIYLNELRESGETNMFGARPYVQAEFGIERGEAGDILQLWMTNFNKDSKYYKTLEVSKPFMN